MAMPAGSPEEALKKEWESLWKRFGEVVSFLYDNEGVVASLKKQRELPTHKEAEKTLNHQINEVHKLIDHHVEDLIQMTQKAATLAKKKGKMIDKECQELSKAIKSLEVEAIQKGIKNLKEALKS